MTIYAVTSGSYSDYGIEQVFLTREKAVAFIKTREAEHEYGDDFRIEEYETYDDHIEIADGYLDDSLVKHEYKGWDDEGKTCDILKAEVKLTVKPHLTNDQIIKIAQDEYAKWKAEKENK